MNPTDPAHNSHPSPAHSPATGSLLPRHPDSAADPLAPARRDALDDILARLSAVETPGGLEARILANLTAHQRSAPSQATPFRRTPRVAVWSRPRIPRPIAAHPWSVPAIAATAAMVLLAALQHHTSVAAPASPGNATSQASRQSTAAPTIATFATGNNSAVTHPQLPSPPVPPVAPPRTSTRTAVPGAPPSSDADLALAELRAPSQLAPPLPLTDDERALQHLAAHSSPSTLLALDPARRAADEAADEVAFTRFFAPPPPSVNPPHGESE